jgi:lipoprotein NlpI
MPVRRWNPSLRTGRTATIPCGTFALFASFALAAARGAEPEHPLAAPVREKLRAGFEETIRVQGERIAKDPTDLEAHSRRGDALFFAGRFQEAAADFDRMIELDPRQKDSHWRRGIACFYADRFKDAAAQFEAYHSFDDVDRENGIWRYFSQAKAYGFPKAKEGLLKYRKDDREPFPDVYRLFAGTIAPAEIVQRIRDAKISDAERQARSFYADLYIGLDHAVAGRKEQAVPFLRSATANEWPRSAGYGPHWMWHVGRVQYELSAKP